MGQGIRRVVLALVLAGCGGGRGVDLEVHAPAGTQKVELVVAPAKCTAGSDAACAAGIAWDTSGPQAPGTIFSADSDARDVLQVPADGVVRFRLESANDEPIARIALVAFDGNDSAIGIAIVRDAIVPSDHAEIWRVVLAPINEIADQPESPPPPGASDAQHVWRAPARSSGPDGDPASYASCVVTQSWDAATQTWSREFLVPSDHDCDNEMIECNGFFYDFNATSKPSPCASGTSNHLPPACLLGASQCADGVSDSSACTVNAALRLACLPDDLCTCSDPGMFEACAREHMMIAASDPSSSKLTYADCGTFPISPDTTEGPCAANNADTIVVASLAAGCTSVRLFAFDVPGVTLLATDQGIFSVGSATFSMTTNPSTNGTCEVTFKWLTGLPNAAPTALLLDASYTASEVLLPVKVAFIKDTCPPAVQTIACPLRGNGSADNMFLCAP